MIIASDPDFASVQSGLVLLEHVIGLVNGPAQVEAPGPQQGAQSTHVAIQLGSFNHLQPFKRGEITAYCTRRTHAAR